MNSKYILFLGILLLLVGVMIRYLSPYAELGVGLVVSGVILKLLYIAFAIIKGQYKPKAEVSLLLLGLVFLFLGLWHKLNISEPVGYAMIAAAISFKLLFVILFIRKTRSRKSLIEP